jgi:hypothetical protein
MSEKADAISSGLTAALAVGYARRLRRGVIETCFG